MIKVCRYEKFENKTAVIGVRQVNSALHPSGVAKSSTSFGWGKGGNVTSAGWQVTLCDPKWYVSSRSGVGRSACKLLYAYFTFFSLRFTIVAAEET